MNHKQFEEFARSLVDDALELMFDKNDGYSSKQDPFHAFNVASKILDEHPVQAAAGMMVKHTASVYKMIGEESILPPPITKEEAEQRISVWDEKILDNINYLIMIRSMIQDQYKNNHYV